MSTYFCEFASVEVEPGRWQHTCTVCGYRPPITKHPRYGCRCGKRTQRYPGERPKPRGPCVHRGEQTRLEVCKGCGGTKVKIKVFACAVHGECTLGQRLPTVAGCCGGCRDWAAKPEPT